MPLISIIVPVYNTERYLSQCLDSLVGQSYSDLEILCIDDGSTDGSGDLLDAYFSKDDRFKVFHRPNSGVSASRNFGLDHASGDYVLFVDSDDFIEPNTCESLLKTAEDSHADIVVFGGITFPSVGWIDANLNTNDLVYRHDSIKALLTEPGSYPLMCNKFYKRAFVETIGARFNTKLKLGEDNAFQFCVFPEANVVAYTSGQFYHYRCEREGSALDTYYSDLASKMARHLDVIDYVLDVWSNRGLLESHVDDMTLWASSFLANDMHELDFEGRRAVSKRFRDICSRYGLAYKGTEEYTRATVAYAQNDWSCERPSAPLVTVLIGALPSETGSLSERCLNELFSASCVDAEFAVVDQTADKRLARACSEVDACFKREADYLSAIQHARGKYVFLASPSYEYGWDALRYLCAHADQTGSDLICCLDGSDRLRMRMGYRSLRTRIDVDTRKAGRELESGDLCFAPQELADTVFQSCSVSPFNKVMKRDLALRAAEMSNSLCFPSIAVLMAEKLCALPDRFIDVCPRAFDAVDPRELANDVFELMEALRSGAETVAGSDTYSVSLQNARLDLASLYGDCLRKDDKLHDYMHVLRQLSSQAELGLSDDASIYLNADDYALYGYALGLYEEEPEEEAYDRMSILEQKLAQVQRSNYVMGRRIRELEESTAIKIGRLITKVPRVIKDKITGKR